MSITKARLKSALATLAELDQKIRQMLDGTKDGPDTRLLDQAKDALRVVEMYLVGVGRK